MHPVLLLIHWLFAFYQVSHTADPCDPNKQKKTMIKPGKRHVLTLLAETLLPGISFREQLQLVSLAAAAYSFYGAESLFRLTGVSSIHCKWKYSQSLNEGHYTLKSLGSKLKGHSNNSDIKGARGQFCKELSICSQDAKSFPLLYTSAQAVEVYQMTYFLTGLVPSSYKVHRNAWQNFCSNHLILKRMIFKQDWMSSIFPK